MYEITFTCTQKVTILDIDQISLCFYSDGSGEAGKGDNKILQTPKSHSYKKAKEDIH